MSIHELTSFLDRKPEIVLEWHDDYSPAKGWLVINSLRGGAAGGGTRIKPGITKEEVMSLSKVMEIKFQISGPKIGGAKSGLDFDPNHPDKRNILKRWYQAIYPYLKNCYGTGGDLNVSFSSEVIPILKEINVEHAQEGIVKGHYLFEKKFKERINRLNVGLSAPTHIKGRTIGDLVTGYGVAESIKHAMQIWQTDLEAPKAIIFGWGNVGSLAAYYLSKAGIKISCIVDKDGGILKEEGLSDVDIEELLITELANHPKYILRNELDVSIENLHVDVFIPAAGSNLISREYMKLLINNGLKMVSCGANLPFEDNGHLYGPIQQWVDQQITLIPDFIANCGMAKAYAILMSGTDCRPEEPEIFHGISSAIYDALKITSQHHKQKTGISRAALTWVLNELNAKENFTLKG